MSKEYPMDSERLYSPKEAALILGIHEHTLYKWRAAGDGPPYLRFSATGRVRYERESLWAWVQERQRSA